MNNLNTLIKNVLYNRFPSLGSVQFNIAVKVLKDTLSMQKDLNEKLIGENMKITPKSLNSTFEYKA
ncbi:MAG TPA: hypothetical protein PKW14_04865 [Bacteroidota bacterium]|nr:hypothetical protein [Bacteroidota bacterium]